MDSSDDQNQSYGVDQNARNAGQNYDNYLNNLNSDLDDDNGEGNFLEGWDEPKVAAQPRALLRMRDNER